MKLSHLSLAVFSAIALAACGGSGNDQTTIKKDPPKDPPKKEVPADKNTPAAANREKNALEFVDAASKAQTETAKEIYFTTSSRNKAAGYNDPTGTTNMEYVKGRSVEADILRRSSIANYVDLGWVNDDANKTLRLNPLQTYALGSDKKYYRIQRPTNKTWEQATATDTFTVVTAGNGKFPAGNDKIEASELVYIPNAWSISSSGNQGATDAYRPDNGMLGTNLQNKVPAAGASPAGVNMIDPAKIDFSATASADNVFDVSLNQVRRNKLNFAGKSYDISNLSNSVLVDTSGIKVADEIQELPISVDYSVVDGKGTNDLRDDNEWHKTAKTGAARVYNLNYSRAMVVINQEAVDNPESGYAEAFNALGLTGENKAGSNTGNGKGYEGEFQVVGRPTGTIPNNGRAVYTGKSFGYNTSGDIILEADFGLDRATINGSITNRVAKTKTGTKDMPNWRLGTIYLSQPGKYRVDGSNYFSREQDAKDGVLYKGGIVEGSWAVQLYGPNARNAGGFIFDNNGKVIEAYSSARGELTDESL